MLATEIATTILQMQATESVPAPALFYLQQMNQALKDRDLDRASQEMTIDTRQYPGADWIYPIKQLQRAVQSIIRESLLLPSVSTRVAL